MTTHRSVAALVLAISSCCLAACGGGDDESASESATVTPTPEASVDMDVVASTTQPTMTVLATDPPAEATAAPAAQDGPTTCDEAIAYIEEKIASGLKMTELPVEELNVVTQATNVIVRDCSVDQANEFFARTDFGIFMS